MKILLQLSSLCIICGFNTTCFGSTRSHRYRKSARNALEQIRVNTKGILICPSAQRRLQTTKLNSRNLKVKTQLYYITYIYQVMVTANNYMFRPLTGHHQVVHLMKRAEDCTIYNATTVIRRYIYIYIYILYIYIYSYICNMI